MSAALKTGGDAKAMRSTKFPEEFGHKVDTSKVNVSVIKKWVADEIARILNSDDDVVPGMIAEALKVKHPNIKKLQLDISGFLDKDAPAFCLALWKLLLSAQQDPNGIPRELLEAKKQELAKEKLEEDRAREMMERRQQADRDRDRDLARMRDREREDRGRGRVGGGGGRRHDRSPPPRDSRSPPPRRFGDKFDRARPYGADSYHSSDRGRASSRSGLRRRSPLSDRSLSRDRRFSPSRRSAGSGRGAPPPRRRSRSPFREYNDKDRSQRRGHDSSYRRRSPSSPPRHRRRRSYSTSDDERHASAPRRRHSPERRRDTRSPSPPPRRPQSPRLAAGDLMSRSERTRNNNRLERPGSSGRESSVSRSSPPRGPRAMAGMNHRSFNGGPQAAQAAEHCCSDPGAYGYTIHSVHQTN